MAKPADQRHGHRAKPKVASPAAVRAALMPVPPDAFLEATKDAWRAYWSSELARALLPVDRPAVDRLFGMYDEHARSKELVRAALMVKGSQGQLRVNPLADHAIRLEGAIVRLENELGLTPAARRRLGINIAPPQPIATAGDTKASRYAHLRTVTA